MTTNSMSGEQFLTALAAKNKLFHRTAAAAYLSSPDTMSWFFDPLAKWAKQAYGEDVFGVAATGYIEYCMNVAKCQAKYEKTGVFNDQSFGEVEQSVYQNDSAMTPYMWAALLIYGFWPSMTEQIKLFREFIEQLEDNAQLAEFACGHGAMGLVAAHHHKTLKVSGLDIGPSAIDIAKNLAKASGLNDRVEHKVQNILTLEADANQQYDAIMAAMLAEHLEQPQLLINSMYEQLKEGGIAYFSTALESAQPDHIYEFRHESEPLVMAEKAGFTVVKMISDGAISSSKAYRPRAMAMLLRK